MSSGTSYAQPADIAASMMLHGKPIDPTTIYRVTVNNFLALGGDGFTVLKEGSSPQFGIYDDEALFAYFQADSPITPPDADRVVKTN